MNIQNDSPFVHGVMLSYLPHAVPALTVISKGTFDIRQNRQVTVAQDQIPLTQSDEYYVTEQPPPSVRIESDLVPYKPRTDIILIGNAYSPDRKPVTKLLVKLRVGTIKKSLFVFGDRWWIYPSKWVTPKVSGSLPFDVMALTYERAYGGVDGKTGKVYEANPVGRGFALSQSKESLHGTFLPNVEDVDHVVSSWKTRPPVPAGFGFIGKDWQTRIDHAGTFDKEWEVWGGMQMPKDFRFEFYNGAHPDLQVPGYLHGTEEVELHNLTSNGYLQCQLSGLRPQATIGRFEDLSVAEAKSERIHSADKIPLRTEATKTQEYRIREQKVELALDTLILLPDEEKIVQVWRGACPLRELSLEEIASVKIQLAH